MKMSNTSTISQSNVTVNKMACFSVESILTMYGKGTHNVIAYCIKQESMTGLLIYETSLPFK